MNLSWNGMGQDGTAAIGEALKTNNVLEELDLSNNRISVEAAILLAKGMYNCTCSCVDGIKK